MPKMIELSKPLSVKGKAYQSACVTPFTNSGFFIPGEK